jgi:hypothetical protein
MRSTPAVGLGLSALVACSFFDGAASAEEHRAARASKITLDDRRLELDYARLRGAISDGAELERTERTVTGVESIVIGAGAAAFSIWGYTQAEDDSSSKTTAIVFMIAGGIYMLGGILDVVWNRGGPLARVEANSTGYASLPAGEKLTRLETQLNEVAESERSSRHLVGVVDIIGGGLFIGAGALVLALDTTNTKTVRNTYAGLLGFIGAKFTFDGIGELTWKRRPAEVVYNTWVRAREEPGADSAPTADASR